MGSSTVIEGYRSSSEADIVYVTVITKDDETLYAAVRVERKRGRIRAEVSSFETPDGEPVDNDSLTKQVKKWVTLQWKLLPTR